MRRLAVLAAVAAAIAASPASAHAFGLSVDKAAPADTSGGAHSDFALQVSFTDGTPKDLAIDLPVGLIGDPNATPKCPVALFTRGACPAATAVGTASSDVRALGVTLTAPGTIYNLVPTGSEPARLGIVLKPAVGPIPLSPIYSQSPISVRPDAGLTSTVTDLPNQQSGIPIEVQKLTLTLQGKTSGGTFMRNPTACVPATTTVRSTPYSGDAASGTASFTPTACDQLPFAPALKAILGTAGQVSKGGRPGLTTEITQAVGEAGAKTVAVTLPAGIGPAVTAVQQACTADAFAAGTCPAAAQVGTASATVPVLPAPLTGPVRLVQATGLPQVDVELNGAINQHLRGSVSFGADGRTTTTFDNIPDVPLSDFTLKFSGGSTGLLASARDLCTATNPPLTATVTSQGGVVKTTNVAPVIEGCPGKVGANGPSKAKKAKGTKAKARISRTGGSHGRNVRLRVTATGVNAKLKRITVSLPKGLRVSPKRAKVARPKGAKLRFLSSKTIRITLRKGAKSATFVVKRGLRASAGLRKAKRERALRLKVATTYAGGGSKQVRAKVKAKP